MNNGGKYEKGKFYRTGKTGFSTVAEITKTEKKRIDLRKIMDLIYEKSISENDKE